MQIKTHTQHSQLLDLANLNGMQVPNNIEGLKPELMAFLSETPKDKNFSDLLAQQISVSTQQQTGAFPEVVVYNDSLVSQDISNKEIVKKTLLQQNIHTDIETPQKTAQLGSSITLEEKVPIIGDDIQLPHIADKIITKQESNIEYSVPNKIDGNLNFKDKLPIDNEITHPAVENAIVKEKVSKPLEVERSILNKQNIYLGRDNELLTPKMINKNAEDASKQFNPVRKSIFDVNRPVDTNNVVKSDFEHVNTVVKQKQSLPYEQLQSSIFKKDLKSKVSEIARPKPENNIMDFMLQQDVKAMDRHIQMPLNNSNLEVATQTASAGAVLELDTLSRTNDRAAVIDQIQNYIVQAKATNQPKVQMSFHHQELGVVDLNVEKAQLGQVNISITTNSSEGMKFFNQHQSDLLGSLSNSGIKVSEFKLDSNTQGDLSQNNSQQQGHSQHTQHRNQDSKRREELWNLFKQHRDAA